jgi:hypothetical protein
VKRRDDLTPSLFDEPDAAVDAPADDVEETDSELDEWQEVPAARFLSWSDAMQLHYCWRRDMDAALRTDSDADATFFLTRANVYKQSLDELKTAS